MSQNVPVVAKPEEKVVVLGEYQVPVSTQPDIAKLLNRIENEEKQLEAASGNQAKFNARIVGSLLPLVKSVTEALLVKSTVAEAAIEDCEQDIEELQNDAGDVSVSDALTVVTALNSLIGLVKSIDSSDPDVQKAVAAALEQGGKALEIMQPLSEDVDDDEDEDEDDEDGDEEPAPKRGRR
jgi:hypothetical protein